MIPNDGFSLEGVFHAPLLRHSLADDLDNIGWNTIACEATSNTRDCGVRDSHIPFQSHVGSVWYDLPGRPLGPERAQYQSLGHNSPRLGQ
jgi:hypothetical protein